MKPKRKFRLATLLFISLLLMLTPILLINSTNSQTTQYGPENDHLRFRVIRSPDVRVWALRKRVVDVVTDLATPEHVELLSDDGKIVTSAPGFHIGYVAANMRRTNFGPQEGGLPGQALRHAIAHLVPKETIIATIFKYVAVKIDTFVPPAMAEWYNPNIDTHRYDPEMAVRILLHANFTWDSENNTWRRPPPPISDGEPLDPFTFLSPTFETAPTSYTVVSMIVDEMTSLTLPDGTPAPLPVTHEPVDLVSLISRVFETHDFDVYFLGWDLGRYPYFLYDFFHSSQDYSGGHNTAGIRNATLDTQLEIIKFSLDHDTKVEATFTAQELLAGSRTYINKPHTDGLLPYCPVIYSRNYYNAYQPELRGIINSPGYGSSNWWTHQSINWKNETEYRRESDLVYRDPGPDGEWGTDDDVPASMIIWALGEYPEVPLSPAHAESVYSWAVLSRIYGSLINVNPYTHEDVPWGAWKWKLEPWTDPDTGEPGMKVTFYLNSTLHWHDGHPVDAFDAKFAWTYIARNKIPRYWSTFQHFHHAEVIDVPINRTVVAYMKQTSQWLIYELAGVVTMSGTALMFPEHIWGCTHERGGRATPNCTVEKDTNYDINGNPVECENGICLCEAKETLDGTKQTCVHNCGCIIDNPKTSENEILMYDPRQFSRWSDLTHNVAPFDPNAQTAYPWLTELIGTGHYVFKTYDEVNGYADLIAYDLRTQGETEGRLGTNQGVAPDYHFFKTQSEIEKMRIQMFHRVGDVNYDGLIDITDLSRIAYAYGAKEGDPNWDPDADLNYDGMINIIDLSIAAKHYYWKREIN